MYYSGPEIIAIAIRIEENGYAFYTAATESFYTDSEIRGLFRDLAEKEVQHIAIFEKLADMFESEKFEFQQDEVADYIAYLANHHIFGKPGAGAELARTVKMPKEALDIALQFENESISFYTELEKRTETDAKKLIRKVIEEERDHEAEIKRFL